MGPESTNADEPLFTVVLATYARPTLLAEAVRSVLDQTVDDFELLVIDDGGPDPLTDLPDDPRMRVIRRPSNGGLAAARNTGVAAARGRYVTFLDDDDLYAPDRLKIALQGLQQAPVTVCAARYLGDTKRGRTRTLSGDVRHRILNHITPPVGATALQRRIVPAFDESYVASQDLDWWLRLSHVAPVTTVRRTGYLVRRHNGERHLNGTQARIDAALRMVDDHWRTYFSRHRRAASFRLWRAGHMAEKIGDAELARRLYLRAFRRWPSLRVIRDVARTIRLDAVFRVPRSVITAVRGYDHGRK